MGASDPPSSDLEQCRKRLTTRLEKWRKSQKTITPQLGDLIANQAVSTAVSTRKRSVVLPEKEMLYLPSQLTLSERTTFGLIDLGRHEHLVQEGAACDAIQKLRTIVKVHVVMEAKKRSEAYGQDRHTRASSRIHEIKSQCDLIMGDYHSARDAMVALGMSADSSTFPILTLNDLAHKATNIKRAVGDSQRMDGMIWTQSGVTGSVQHASLSLPS